MNSQLKRHRVRSERVLSTGVSSPWSWGTSPPGMWTVHPRAVWPSLVAHISLPALPCDHASLAHYVRKHLSNTSKVVNLKQKFSVIFWPQSLWPIPFQTNMHTINFDNKYHHMENSNIMRYVYHVLSNGNVDDSCLSAMCRCSKV